jgi:hypothetical protein
MIPLIEQGCLQWCGLARQPPCQFAGFQAVAGRLHPETSEPRMIGKVRARYQVHVSEAPRVIVDHPRPACRTVDVKHRMIVAVILRARLMEHAGAQRGVAIGFDAERSRHAQMRDQRHAVVEIRNQIFGPAAHRGDPPAFKPRGEVHRKGKPQIRAPLFDPRDHRAFHHRLQSAANGLDFGQFGQIRLLCRAPIGIGEEGALSGFQEWHVLYRWPGFNREAN